MLLLFIHRDIELGYNKIVDIFALRNARRMLLQFKLNKIRLRIGLSPRPRWRNTQRSQTSYRRNLGLCPMQIPLGDIAALVQTSLPVHLQTPHFIPKLERSRIYNVSPPISPFCRVLKQDWLTIYCVTRTCYTEHLFCYLLLTSA